jgi:DNA-binding transcriptional regulator YhcF (GntR family)
MIITITRDSEEPVYAQIARQIRVLIASGDISAGSSLASVRRLARDLGINLNTVARAYRLLESERFVVIEARRGVRVAPPSPTADAGVVHSLRDRLKEIVHRLRQAGVHPDEIRRMVWLELGLGNQGKVPEI